MRADAGRWYAEKSVAVLGASGFLGAHLVSRLRPACRDVVAFVHPGAAVFIEELEGAQLVFGDVRSAADVRRAIHGADVVFQMAGRSGAVASERAPFDDLDVNVRGMLTVLEVARSLPAPPRVVFPGSRLQYGSVESNPVAEDAPMRPLVPYGLHKHHCEQLLQLYARRHGIGFAVARLTNPFGPWPTKVRRGYNVLNLMIARALEGEAIEVYGDGAQLRDYLYVDDAVDALLMLGSAPDDPIVNVGSGTGVSMIEAARAIVRLCGRGDLRHVPWPEDALAVETGDFVADISAVRARGWEPRTSLEEGLRKTIECRAAPAWKG
ncbi:MAG TPA: NAD-dependent epimerase/dehydratase family protein [Candidatus Dormibacteraeota bacterium]|nr:NAD-dependent epimerase/dehydratase family protein [Candidatus Dormibacteraeota bacterium]